MASHFIRYTLDSIERPLFAAQAAQTEKEEPPKTTNVLP
jgi:hypothetical protein